MSEILLDGEAKSAKISSLDPSLYFDASALLDDDKSATASIASIS